MGGLTYVCFVPAKGLIRDLSANSSKIALAVPLASKRCWQYGAISHKDSQLRCRILEILAKPGAKLNNSQVDR